MSKINMLNRPHQSELDLEIEHVLKDADDIKEYIFNMVINKNFNEKDVNEVKYKCENVILLLEKINKNFVKFNLSK